MHRGRTAALSLALLLAAAPKACALEAARAPAAYGGSGEDSLQEVVSCGDGLFAVGTTASTDYELSMRTRKGETGWALRLDSDGSERFSFCSARSGMTRMTAPAAFEDGAHSLVLTDEAMQRGEWIVLDEQGKSISRVAFGDAAALCSRGEEIVQLLPIWADNSVQLAALVRHADGQLCCARLAQDGTAAAGEAFAGGASGMLCAGRDEDLAYVAVREGELCILHLTADGTIEERFHDGLTDGVQIEAIGDALLGGDESVTVCGAAKDGGGFLLRVSREGERLFLIRTDAPLVSLTATDTGYAALEDGRILFADEDGVSIAWADAPQNTLDLTSSLSGAVALSKDPERGRRQAVFTHVTQPQLHEAAASGEAADNQADAGSIPAGEGYLLCSAEDAFGVRVRHVTEDGEELFSVRTPIHTAADALEWLCAAKFDDGSILLGGRYLYGSGSEARQQGVTALLSGDGVLRRMETTDGAGAVCVIETTSDGEILLHAATADTLSMKDDAIIVYSR